MGKSRLERSGAFVSDDLTILMFSEIEVKMLIRDRWFYIVFMNAIWIAFPLWSLRQAYLHAADHDVDSKPGSFGKK